MSVVYLLHYPGWNASYHLSVSGNARQRRRVFRVLKACGHTVTRLNCRTAEGV